MKKVLSLILALAMLLGCSLMVFAAEPCEECNEGTLRPTLEQKPAIVDCVNCPAKAVDAVYYYNAYFCDNCDDHPYDIFSHYWIDCGNCGSYVCYSNLP